MFLWEMLCCAVPKCRPTLCVLYIPLYVDQTSDFKPIGMILPIGTPGHRRQQPSQPCPHPLAMGPRGYLLGLKPIEGRSDATRTLSAALLMSQVPRMDGILRSICSTGVLYTSSSTREPVMDIAACRLKKGWPCASAMAKLSFLKAPICSCMTSTVF